MRAVSGKEFCKARERRGWQLVRVRGSHVYAEPGGGRSASVPVHGNKTLKTGTQHGLMRRTGLTEDDL